MAEADWSDLPEELLDLISQQIDIEIDLIRFRSVCSSWRRSSSLSNHHLNLTIKFPLLNIPNILPATITSFCCLSKRSIFLIKPPPSQLEEEQTPIHRRPWLISFISNLLGKTKLFHPLLSYPRKQQKQSLIRPWLVRITQNSSGKIKLFPPLISHLLSSTSFHLPHLFDFNKLSVLHLGTDFISNEFAFDSVLLPIKVISIGKHSLALAILKTGNAQLMLFRCGNEPWKEIDNISTNGGDICVFKRRFYAVSQFGTTVMIGMDSTVQLVAKHVVDGWDRKMLVESDGELLLVDICNILHLSIKVFRFHEKEKKWVKLMNLGDRVLFFGKGCSFSTSASDLCVSKGNCIVFIDDVIPNIWKLGGNRVYRLDQDRVSSLSEYFNLFLPPPDWILKS